MQTMFWRNCLAATSLVLLGAALIAPHAANAAGKYDGDWAGVPAIQANSNPDCPRWPGFRLHIMDDKFNQEVGRAQMQSPVAADGSFSTSGSYALRGQGMQRTDFAGRIAGDQLNAVYHTKYCTYNMALRRR